MIHISKKLSPSSKTDGTYTCPKLLVLTLAFLACSCNPDQSNSMSASGPGLGPRNSFQKTSTSGDRAQFSYGLNSQQQMSTNPTQQSILHNHYNKMTLTNLQNDPAKINQVKMQLNL